jgi:hypothetical protein
MNPDFLGDSFDIVKRFFCQELANLGYRVLVDPMFTGDWKGREQAFFQLICAHPELSANESRHTALFIDPDTGVREIDGKLHVSFDRLVRAASSNALVFSFDQSFSRQAKPDEVMSRKLATIEAQGCYGMYYNSHARFLFVSSQQVRLRELRNHLVSLGLPSERLLHIGT